MNLTEVNNPFLIRQFLQVPVDLYKDNPNYIRPLDEDVENVFTEGNNKYYEAGKCIRWILTDKTNKAIGRIAAFVNPFSAYTFEQPTGGIGFFECINDKKAAFMLFDAARDWLKQQNMEAMDGPVNLGSRERWWGLLVEGFSPPCYCCNYNPYWYRDFFEEYGFKVFFKQYTYLRNVREPLKKVYYDVAARIFRNPDYSFRNIKKKNLESYIHDFRAVYNKAWVNHEGVGEMSFEAARKMISSLTPVIDERIAWFAYYKNEPVGFFLSIPELNELFVKYAKGKLNLTTKLRLLFNKWTGKCRTMYGLVFGIIPEQQKKGVEIAMIVAAANSLLNNKAYENVQMNWIGDFNPRMMHIAEQIGARVYKTHHTYRYLFDRSSEFKRHPEI
ncbi:hypothetical protein BDE36_4411 [Arcticibacter tournemirensis]|uniref:GNAT family N-acetyltransferase n=1 Tax=Arcticibacter tournemirensis TaxID=699437 RepID=A0A5M9H8U4_9SPHI|nr:hypothetical protein [Arcticibacter tournemirensis]KAA8482615.1 hypothetical protein F1649_11615 [Arcticibacter tournemirensis]TQM52590.1 hypothetical protein BDE36_4411 [Arcticibacter tournemirensis]